MHGVGKAIAELIERVTCFGRVICSWCNKDMGPSKTDMDSHGICADCAKKM
jgi:hypothetical protein